MERERESEVLKATIALLEADEALLIVQLAEIGNTLSVLRRKLAERTQPTGDQLALSVDFTRPNYSGAGMRDAALDILRRCAGQARKTHEIAQAMEAGGFVSRSKHFRNSLNTTLVRMKEAGDVQKTADGWMVPTALAVVA